MKVFRIEREKYLDSTLLGIGASMSNAFRWNSQYTRMVYTSESRALATLEVSVHLDLNEDLPNDRHYVEIEIPDSLLILELKQEDLPEGWNAKPPEFVSQAIGDEFVRSNKAAVLKAPSCIVPFEYNYLINPFHPEARQIKVLGSHLMRFDERL